jgi:hypothetical protein
MTGGVAVILGPTGKNFGAGMSGGIAYVYDPDRQLEGLSNVDVKGDLLPVEVRVVCTTARIGLGAFVFKTACRVYLERGSVSCIRFGHGVEGIQQQNTLPILHWPEYTFKLCRHV